ncbi:MAG TPA: hypothetical protein VFZ33_18340 [Chitinophagaceae bacterium]
MTITSKEIFNQYFKRKLILWVSIGVIATIIRLLGGHQTSFVFVVTMMLFFVMAALIIGYIDYRFYEKSAPKIISQLLDKEPFLSFQKIGFIKEEANKLEGQINNYKIILSPLTNLQSDKVLTVLIPLQIREGLDDYFTKYNDHFRFTLSGEIIFAEAILKDYEKQYGYDGLVKLIDKTTISLKENKIEPLKIVDD